MMAIDIFTELNFQNINLHISEDSRNIKSQDIFLLTSANKKFITDVISNGVKLIISITDIDDHFLSTNNIVLSSKLEDFLAKDKKDIRLIDLNSKIKKIDLLMNFYQQTKSNICVTGTNGKTSTVHFLRNIANLINKNTTTIENCSVYLNNQAINYPNALTTPASLDMYKISQIGITENNSDLMIFEASSHGIEQDRINGLNLNVIGFTNFSQDHLDYHKTIEAYFNAKTKIFTSYANRETIAVLNADIPEFEKIQNICIENNIKTLAYGMTEGSDFQILTIKQNGAKLDFKLQHKDEQYALSINCFGDFQAYNFTCAIAMMFALGTDLTSMIQKVSNQKIQPPDGRMQEVESTQPNQPRVFIDYAHTPDALKSSIESIRRSINKDMKILVIFGCGGDRDSSKRAQMGSVAERFADFSIITNDNPRTEEPQKIASDILAGYQKPNDTTVILDRKEAIEKTIQKNDHSYCILIAGKGHEQYQIVGNKKSYFNDYEIAKNALKAY